MKTPDLPHALRAGDDGDRGYVISTWLQSYRNSPMGMKLPEWAYWSHWGQVGLVEHLIKSGHLLIACLSDSPAWIYGWACGLGAQVHYVFVRYEYRRQGFGSLLLRECHAPFARPAEVTHMTADGSRLLRGVPFVNPYRGENNEGHRSRVSGTG